MAGGEPNPIGGWEKGQEIIGFSPDGRSAYVQMLDSMPAQVDRLEIATGKRRTWKSFRPQDMAGVTALNPILLPPDQRAYAYNYESVISELYVLTSAL
jgi:hypothetical protein